MKKVLFILVLLTQKVLYASNLETMPAEDAYDYGMYYFADGNYTTALEHFSEAQKKSPFSEIHRKSSMMYAFINYLEEETEKVSSTVDMFKSMYPNDEYVDYMLYLKGVSIMKSIKDSSRAFNLMQKSIDIFEEVKDTKGIYKEKADKNIKDLHFTKQLHLFNIAQTFEEREEYISAIKKYNSILQLYKDKQNLLDKEIEKKTKAKLENLKKYYTKLH